MEHFPLENRLHTDVLEDKYGPVHANVLLHNDDVRETHLLDKQDVSRTYALTLLSFDKNNTELLEINKKIKEGGSIGKTFRQYGYEVRKNVIDVFVLNLPRWLQKSFQGKKTRAKARISEFYFFKEGTQPDIYGSVLEVYSPDFRDANINNVDREQIRPISKVLYEIGFSPEQVWASLINQKTTSSSNKKIYKKALEGSKHLVEEIREKMLGYINHEMPYNDSL